MQNIVGSKTLFNGAGEVNSNKEDCFFLKFKMHHWNPNFLKEREGKYPFQWALPRVLMLKYLDLKFASQPVSPKYRFCFCPRTHTYLPHHGSFFWRSAAGGSTLTPP